MNLPRSDECPRVSNACLQGNRVVQRNQRAIAELTHTHIHLLKLSSDEPRAFKHFCGDSLPFKEAGALLPILLA